MIHPFKKDWNLAFKYDKAGKARKRRFSTMNQLGKAITKITSLREDPENFFSGKDAELGTILDAIPVLISYVDKTERYRFNNKAYEGWFRIPRSEMRGQHIRDVLGDAAYAEIRPVIGRVLQGEALEYEGLIPFKFGELRYVRTIFQPHQENGEVMGFFVIANDITQSKRIEADLEESRRDKSRLAAEVSSYRKRLVDIVQSVPGVVWEAWGLPDSSHQRINFVSDHVEAMLGYTVEEWLRVPNFWLSIVHPEDKERAAQEGYEIFMGMRPGLSQFRWLTKDGRAIWVEAHSVAVKDEAGQPIGMRGVTMDITERKIAEQKILEANDELQRLHQIKSQFTSVVTHELRTPLAAIKEGIDITLDELDGPLSQGNRENLNIATTNVDRLARLISNVLDFSRIEAGVLELYKDAHDLKRIVADSFRIMKFIAQKKGLRFDLDIPATAVSALCDADKIKQVIINLLDNAIKFTPPDGTVLVRLESDAAAVRIHVQDDGPGIEPRDQEKIFQMYWQSLSEPRVSARGAGVGLAVCRKIMDLHGGKIFVKSTPGQGSHFTVGLPL